MDAHLRLIERLDRNMQVRNDLALTDYEILMALSEAPEHRLRMSDLAERILVSRSRLTYRVDGMADRGYVMRSAVRGDKRGVWAQLQPGGLKALEEAAPGHVEDVRVMLMDLIQPDELDGFHRVWDRVLDALDSKP